jgi:predicted transcriptional regulator
MQSKTNITLKIDRELLREIKILAAREGTSISALMTELLANRVKRDLHYEQAKRRALARLREGLDLGGRPLSRDEIHER